MRVDDYLSKELEEFNREKERIRKIVGSIGGKQHVKHHLYINLVFLGIVIITFLLGAIFHKIELTLSLELGVLLVSVKIAWMIHDQQKTNHFQFWILNSLEFRINEIHKRTKQIEKKLEEFEENKEKNSM
jgi:hypothetical protein